MAKSRGSQKNVAVKNSVKSGQDGDVKMKCRNNRMRVGLMSERQRVEEKREWCDIITQ